MSRTRTASPSAPSRRLLLRLAAAGTLAPSVAACGGRSGGSGLSATWWGDPGLNDAMSAAIGAFRRAGPHRPAVRSEFLPWEGYWDKLATRSADGDTPDLVMQAATYLPEYVGRDALLTLDPYLGESLSLTGVDKDALSMGRYRGRTYAVVAATNALALIVNRSLLRRILGGPLPNRPALPGRPGDTEWTWEDLEAVGREVHHRSGGRVYGVQDAGGDLMHFQVFVRQRGRELFDTHDRVAYPRAWLTEWLEMWQRWRRDGIAPPPDMTAESTGVLAQTPMVRRRAAMTFGWTQDLPAHAAVLADDYALLLPPGPSGGGGRPGLWVNAASLWAAAANTRRPEQVVALIDFLLNSHAAEVELGGTLGTPPRAEARDRLRKGADMVTRTGLDYMDRVARHSTPLPRVWPGGFTELRDEFGRYNEDVGFGRRTPAAAADAFTAFAQQVVAA